MASILAALPAALLFTPSPAIGANSLQSILSPAGLNAYDTATAGSYFKVSQTDFDNAASSLASVTKLGSADIERTNTCASNWSANYVLVLDNTIKIPANTYVLGYAIRMSTGVSGTQYSRLVTSSTYKGSYDFLVGSNYPNSVAGMNYYLFKEPLTSSNDRYIGTWATATQCGVPYSSTTGGYLGGSTAPFSGTFSTQTTQFPFLQLLYTTVDQWSIPTTISLSTSGSTSVSTKGSSLSISTAQNKEGLVTFKANGKNIPRCISLQSTGLTVTCNWKPSNQGSIAITATLRSPTSAFTAATSAPLRISVGKRTTTR